jgi:predicted PurR-regulated permease PerM
MERGNIVYFIVSNLQYFFGIILIICFFIYVRHCAIALILIFIQLFLAVAAVATGAWWLMAMFVLVFIYIIYLAIQELIKNFTNYSPVNNSRLNNRSNNTRTSTAKYLNNL